MLWMGENMVTSGKVKPIQEILSEVRKVSAQDILRVATNIFRNKNLNIALIGPISDADMNNIKKKLSVS